MKLTVEKFLGVSGLGYLTITASYGLVYLANYDTISGVGIINYITTVQILKLSDAGRFDSAFIWGVASFWGIMSLVSLTLWRENKRGKLQNYLKDETILFGILPFIIVLGYHFGLGLENYLLLFVTGLYALVSVGLYFPERE